MFWINFTEKEILTLPKDAGVYALAVSEHDALWVYVGESSNLQRRIWQHFLGESPQSRCIHRYAPKRVGIERISHHPTRIERENQLILEKYPCCTKGTPLPPDKTRAA